jgi:hypothetical protein
VAERFTNIRVKDYRVVSADLLLTGARDTEPPKDQDPNICHRVMVPFETAK